MAKKDKKKEYSSIIDSFLAGREPDWKELGLKDAIKSGDTQLDRTHDYVDGDILDEIADSAANSPSSYHTMLPSGGRGRKKSTEESSPKIGSVPEDWARHSHNAINEDSVLGEALHSLESVHGNDTGLKKAISDADVIGRIDKILGSGLTAAAKSAALKKLGEIELFNKGMATDYLNRTAPQLGINYLEPNAYMDKNSPAYEREGVSLASTPDPAALEKNIEAKKGSGPAILASYGYVAGKTCTDCGATLMGAETKGDRCNECLDKGASKSKEAAVEAPAPNVFTHESGASIKVGNGWSYRAKGGVEQNFGTSFKALIAFLNKIHVRQTPVEAGQRSGEVSVMSSQGGMRRNVEQKFAHTTSQVAAQTIAEFDSGDVEKFRKAGQSLSHIYRFAEAKVGTLGASKAINEWLRGKKQASGKLVLASADVDFLRDKMGYRIPSRTEARTVDVSTVNRNLQKQAAPEKQAMFEFTASAVDKLHKAKYTLAQIYDYAEKKFGSVIAAGAIKGWLRAMHQSGNIPHLASSDKDTLRKLGFKPLRESGEVTTNVHKAAATSPKDGHAMMNEFDLMERTPATDINTDGVKFEDVEPSGPLNL
jgi:hypothetical protein